MIGGEILVVLFVQRTIWRIIVGMFRSLLLGFVVLGNSESREKKHYVVRV